LPTRPLFQTCCPDRVIASLGGDPIFARADDLTVKSHSIAPRIPYLGSIEPVADIVSGASPGPNEASAACRADGGRREDGHPSQATDIRRSRQRHLMPASAFDFPFERRYCVSIDHSGVWQ
jgi:hypothetical protein